MARARAEKLFVHAAGDRWSWLLIGRDGVRDHGESPAEAPDWPAERSACLLLDASRCVGLRLDLPPLKGRRLMQALRWAAEDQLAGSAEDEHVVPGPRDAEGRLCCVSVSRSDMAGIDSALDGRPVERMLPDALCLPWADGEVALAEHGGRILVRWGHWSFAAFEAGLAEELVTGAVPAGARWCWYGGAMPDWVAATDPVRADDRPLLARLAETARTIELNLFSGEWAPKSATVARSQWRWAAGLAAAVLVLVLGYAGLERYQLAQRSDALEAAIQSQFGKAFPEVGRIVSPRVQAERELARLRFGQAAGFLDLMHRVAPVVDGQSGLSLERLDYRDGALELGLRAPDVAALDELEQRLRALDLVAEVQSASLDDSGASGRIRIARRGEA